MILSNKKSEVLQDALRHESVWKKGKLEEPTGDPWLPGQDCPAE
jgi:hypothetical protein